MQLAVDLFNPLLEKTFDEQVLKELSESTAMLWPQRQRDSSREFPPPKNNLFPFMTKLGVVCCALGVLGAVDSAALIFNFENSCQASSAILSFLPLQKANSAISDLWPILHLGAINTLNFSSSVMANVSGDNSNQILKAASQDIKRVSSQLSFLRKSFVLMSMISLRSLLQCVCMYLEREKGTCSYMQCRVRFSWQILSSLMRQELWSNSRFLSISAFFSSSYFWLLKYCTSQTRMHLFLPVRSSKGQRPPYTCKKVSIIINNKIKSSRNYFGE